jgi:ribosomal protein L40E
MIITWICQFCGWANDNNNGPCRKCEAHTEMRLVKGKWKEVTIVEPKKVERKA